MSRSSFFLSLNLFISVLFSAAVNAADIVRLQLDYNGSNHNLDLELLPDTAPLTVANYLDYVTSGSYDGTFIYRSLPGFVLQTGGYTFRPIDPINNALRPIAEGTGLERVIEGPLSPVTNEFNLSNIRGTIAMAKLPNQPDSATNEWFINLADNSENLDIQNEGFTVFGKVIDDGMVIADEIATFPIHQFIQNLLGSAFDEMPVTGEIFGAIYQKDMLMISSASVINRPIARLEPAIGDFNLNVAGDSIDEVLTVTIKNTGDETLVVGSIDDTSINLPFSAVNDSCSSSVLLPQSTSPASACTIDLVFSPVVTGEFTESLVVPYTSQNTGSSFTVTYDLTGEGVPSTPVLFSEISALNFLDTIINTSIERSFKITNKGGNTLNITNVSVSGTDSSDFIYLSGCATGTTLSMEESCDITLQFSPMTTGEKATILKIESSAGTLDIDMTGTATKPVISVDAALSAVAQVNQTASALTYVTNAGSGNLILSSINISGPDGALFTQLNNCPDTNNVGGVSATLGPAEQCIVLVEYTPNTTGAHSATLTIESNDIDSPSAVITLNGYTDNPAISVPESINFGTAQVNGQPVTRELIVTNLGSAPLEISSITGLSDSSFVESNNCIGNNIQVNLDQACSIFISFTATDIGSSNIVLSIESNDPSKPVSKVTLEAYGDKDTDGILSDVELNAPNNGDGNNDNITDDVQNNVASFSTNNITVTLISDNAALLLDTGQVIEKKEGPATALLDINVHNIPAEYLANETYSLGSLNFDIIVEGPLDYNTIGISIDVGILLPLNIDVDKYYRFGPTPDNSEPHIYDFTYNSSTGLGARSLGKVSIAQNGSAGDVIERNIVIISYRDGELGDDDLILNGKIKNDSGVFTEKSQTISDESAGTLSTLILFIPLIFRLREHSIRYLNTTAT